MNIQLGASVEAFYVEPSSREEIPMVDVIRQIVEDGFAVELWTSHPNWQAYTESEISMICDICQAAPFVSAHTGLSSWDPDSLRNEIALCEGAGASTLVVHSDTLGLDKATSPPDYNQIAALAQAARQSGVYLALENTKIGMAPLTSLLNVLGPEPSVTGLGICFDVGHAAVAHDRHEHSVADYLRTFREQLRHLHVHDVVDGKDHFLPGHGEIDWQSTAAALEEIEFDGYQILELLRPGEPMKLLREARQFLLDLFGDRQTGERSALSS